MLGPNDQTYKDSSAADILTEQHFQTFEPSHTNHVNESTTRISSRLSEVDLSADLMNKKPQYLDKDTSPGSDKVHSTTLRDLASVSSNTSTHGVLTFAKSRHITRILEADSHYTNSQRILTQGAFNLPRGTTFLNILKNYSV